MILIVFYVLCPFVLFGRPAIALTAMLGAVFHTPALGVLQIGALDFTQIRLLIILAIIRIFVRGEARQLRWSAIDLWLITMISAMLALSIFTSDIPSKLMWRLGYALNTAGIYFTFRCWIRTPQDFRGACAGLGIVILPWAAELVLEQLTYTNYYAELLQLQVKPAIRDGRIRSQGCFLHAILAGTAAASSFFLILLARKERPKIAWLGAGAAFTGMIASASSGPLMTFMTVIGALALWYARTYIRFIRWATIGLLVLLHLAMKAPVWWLLARIDLTGSSTGDHRAALIDAALKYFGEWALVGTEFTRHWLITGVSWSEDQIDITNHYLYIGVESGLPAMIPFIMILVVAFKRLGRMLQEVRRHDLHLEKMLWTIGSVLFAHCVTFISVSYFDSSFVLVLLPLATIAGLSSQPLPLAAPATDPFAVPDPRFDPAAARAPALW